MAAYIHNSTSGRLQVAPSGPRARVLFVFVDGIGLAPRSEDNPFSAFDAPTFRRLLEGPLTIEQIGVHPLATLLAVDACLGIAGLPQSATGQATLFSGTNAAAMMGRHVVAFPGPRLRALLIERNLFAEATRRGLCWTFANAFSDHFFAQASSKRRRLAVIPWSVLMGGGVLRSIEDLRHNRAVSWDIERDVLFSAESSGSSAPRSPLVRQARDAGRDLARLAQRHDLTVYETFLTDLVGHGRLAIPAAAVVARIDAFLEGVLSTRSEELSVVVTSDHGNFEALGHTRHTRNPVPLLAVGPNQDRLRGVRSLDQVVSTLFELLV